MKKWILYALILLIFFSSIYLFIFILKNKQTITQLIQYAPHTPLEGVYMEEMLAIHGDGPLFWSDLSEKQLEQSLKHYPVIAEGRVKKRWPDTLEVTYRFREPLCKLFGKEWGVDKEGVSFPLTPFFTPRELPKLIGDGRALSVQMEDVDQILTSLKGKKVALIDFSFDEEIVLHILDPHPHYIRLSKQHFKKGLMQYHQLPQQQEFLLYDMRFKGFALLG